MIVQLLCGVVLLCGIAAFVWLKRAGEREWEAHLQRQRMLRFSAAFASIRPAMEQMAVAIKQAERAMGGLADVLRSPR